MAECSWIPLNFLKSRMTDGSTGFNYWIQQAIASENYPAASLAAAGLTNTFAFNYGQNLFLFNGSVDVINAAGCNTFPVCQLYNIKGVNDKRLTPTEFAGPILSMIKITLGWKTPISCPDTESPQCCIEDALLATFNSSTYYTELSGTGCQYNNDIQFQYEEPDVIQGTPLRKRAFWVLTHTVETGVSG